MAFKIPSKTAALIKDPESLFRDLRNRTVEGLMSQQADMLRAYMGHIEAHDIALELPTGSGKTLVGLLIAEWRRRTRNERCVFLCPTKQLVHQVVEQAKEKYGIQALDFAGSKHSYSEGDKSSFANCEAIGVATYSALFNTNPFFSDVHTIVFDDAHAAENYVSSFWSLEISRFHYQDIFDAIWRIIAPHTPENDQLRQNQHENSPLDSSYVNKLPTPYLISVKNDLISVLDNECTQDEHRYKWQMIRDHLHACHLYYTSSSILIRPLIAPTRSFQQFENARQRIYMSATLGEGGDLERIFGREKIKRIPAPDGWDKQGIGRRFFMFPMRIWDEELSLEQSISWVTKFNRALVLTPSNQDADRVRVVINANPSISHYLLFDASNLEVSKKCFVSESAIAVLANRYDGIDLIGDECRYLIVYGLPESTNLQERFVISRLGASVLFRVRIRTRVTQAVGRCTRSATDYALVVVLGDKIHQYFHKPENREALHPELQAEVNFGVDQSQVDDAAELDANIDNFIQHNDEWETADSHILETRDSLSQAAIPSTEFLEKIVSHEVKYQNCLWAGDYDQALSFAKNVLADLSGDDLRGYRALWNYLAGSAAFVAGQTSVAQDHYAAAAAAANALPWLKCLRNQVGEQSAEQPVGVVYGERIERIEALLEKFGKANSRKIEQYFSSIRNGLASAESKPFEAAQVKLGRLLGFEADNSDAQGAPDPWWVLGRHGIVFEDYTATGENPVVSKSKAIQAKAHPDTLADKYPGVQFHVVFCTTSKMLDGIAKPHVSDISYISVADFKVFSEVCMAVIRVLWDSYSSPGDIKWREVAATKLTAARLGINELLADLTKTELTSLGNGG